MQGSGISPCLPLCDLLPGYYGSVSDVSTSRCAIACHTIIDELNVTACRLLVQVFGDPYPSFHT